jgi:hypothetical protein
MKKSRKIKIRKIRLLGHFVFTLALAGLLAAAVSGGKQQFLVNKNTGKVSSPTT